MVKKLIELSPISRISYFRGHKKKSPLNNKIYGYIKEGKVFRAGFLDFPDLEIGELKSTEEESLKYFENRFELIKKQVDDVKEKIESNNNKGSFLMKVIHLKETLPAFDAIGDFQSLYETLNSLHDDLQTYINTNRHKNLQIKTALLEELKAVADSHEWKSASAVVREIQEKWIKTGAVAVEHKEHIEDHYKELIDRFYKRRSDFYKDMDKMMADKEAEFTKFIEKAEELKSINDLQKLKKEIRAYQANWKALGKIKPVKHNAFWKQFQDIVQSALKTAKELEKEKINTGSKENKLSKESIISRLDLISKDLVPKVDLQSIKSDWRAVGPASRKDEAELYDRFLWFTGLISEKKFLNDLLERKTKKGASDESVSKLRIRLLRDLLDRDIKELRTFEENLGKFNMGSGLDGLLEKKLNQQKRKVEIKKAILDGLKKM